MSSDPEEMEDDSATRLLSTSTADGGAYLLAVQGSAMGLMVKVTDGLVVGRGKDAGFRIPDDQISRAHLRIRISAAGTVRVKDLGSRNGTLVNGQMVSAARLTAGDRIRIGGTVLAYTDVEGLEATLNRLRKMISDELSEHTDDISQFAEILQVAPTIFSAFVDEANLAAGRLEDLLETDHDSQRLAAAARSVHTLKGNARSLGLNFIGGRAHAIEELMARIGDSRASWRQREALADLLDDLRRAIRRAGARPAACGHRRDAGSRGAPGPRVRGRRAGGDGAHTAAVAVRLPSRHGYDGGA
jgi:pSer/pThr/pTyr-binding forkhead associated (FHA) protein